MKTMAKPSPFGAWIRKWRKSRGMTQAQLAKSAGLGQSIISQYERGVKTDVGGDFTRPEPETVERLAIALNRPVEEARVLAGYNPSPVPVMLKEVDRIQADHPGTAVLLDLLTGAASATDTDAIDAMIAALQKAKESKLSTEK